MAAKKKKGADALVAQTDPKAPLDGAAFLSAAQKTLKALAEDLLARADGSASITEGLKARWAAEQEKRRTGDAYEPWRRRFVVQVGVAWILGCVFARTLEDRGLVDRNRVAGPGAADSVRQFLDMAPHLTEREYLLTVFRELANLRAARDLFDARHNPVWKLAPSADGAKLLMDLFRGPDAEAPAFRFGQSDTRFLGDLYQDLSDEVRERFALLQTPRFVESFILDQTLEPAIKEFGLDRATIIDPTCGSGHFLLGAFERLVDHRLRAQPGLDVREAAVKALDAVHGADINPYAAAIARFRLVLAFLERGSYARIEDAPELPIHVVVGDSLLHGRGSSGQEDFAHVAGTDASKWKDDLFALEDEAEAKRVLRRRYSAVVGNPPYITVKDAVLREEYRKLYESAFNQYSLGAPFTERFFDLARESGFAGMITANSFMKREFGKRLIESVLPRIDLELVVNTSGAYVPGHGTPTVLLFGRNRPSSGRDIHVVLGRRGEPSTPDDPAKGLVWRSIVENLHTAGFENEFISVSKIPPTTLQKHPWSLGGGGAAELKELLESRGAQRLEDAVESIGFSVITGEDNVLMAPRDALLRAGLEGYMRRNVVGEEIRDWATADGEWCVWPNNDDGTRKGPHEIGPVLKHLWPYRTTLRARKAFGTPVEEKGIPWWALREVYAARMKTPLTIAFAFVATHNHFVLDRGGKVFKQSAPIIKLPPEATEDDHLALLAYLNSSTACFWMKQVMQPKGSTAANRNHPDPARACYEFAGTAMLSLPIPDLQKFRTELVTLARKSIDLAEQRRGLLAGALQDRWSQADALKRISIAVQEEIDWIVYDLFGFAPYQSGAIEEGLGRGYRPFEVLKGRRSFVREAGAAIEADLADVDLREPEHSPALAATLEARSRLIGASVEVNVIEDYTYKRLWRDSEENEREAVIRSKWDRRLDVESWLAQLEREVRAHSAVVVPSDLTPPFAPTVAESAISVDTLLREDAVPFLAAHTYSASGMEKHAAWEACWQSQRLEDAGIAQDASIVPPRYDADDFRENRFFSLRGKLDVPKERFISYPGCESDEDKSPVYGWAGWDHLQRAQALSALYQKRKNEEAWGKDRLTPMLAGLQELVPWLKQWHNDPDPHFGGERLGNFFADFVASECQALGLTFDDLKNWRPAARSRGGKPSKTAVVIGASANGLGPATTQPTEQRRRRKSLRTPTAS